MASETIGVTAAIVSSDEMQFFTGLGRDADVDAEQAVAEAVTALPESVEGYPHLTGLVISSTVGRGEEIAWQASQQHPIQWVGGAASDLNQENMAVFVDDGAQSARGTYCRSVQGVGGEPSYASWSP